MKEYSKKFSADPDDQQPVERQGDLYPAQPQPPAFHDLRFVVKESVNLGFRFITEIEKMLKKLED
jgi:hypothetical protein